VGNFLNQPTEKLKEAVVVLNGELCATKKCFCSPSLLTPPCIFDFSF